MNLCPACKLPVKQNQYGAIDVHFNRADKLCRDGSGQPFGITREET